MPVDSAFLNWAGQKPDIAAVQVYARKSRDAEDPKPTSKG